MWVTLLVLGVVLAAVTGMVLVRRRRGLRMRYLDAWEPEPGERVLGEDRGADVHVVQQLGEARYTSYGRPRRSHVVVTDRRIVVATRALLSRRYAITHMIGLTEEGAPADLLDRLDGGLFLAGYSVVRAAPAGITVEDDGGRRYLRVVPEDTRSATNVDHLRLYSDMAGHLAELAGAGP